MPLTPNRNPEIVTIPIVAATNTFTYVFNLDLPTVPLNSGASSWQLLWMQIAYVADATVGTRVPVFDLQDDAAVPNQIYSVASINTQAAGTTATHTILEGAVIFPVSIFGLMRTIPNDGLFGFNNWSVRFQDLAGISAGDSMSGFMQVRLF